MTGDLSGPPAPPAGNHLVQLRHAGRERPNLLHVPPGDVNGVPLVVELHGRGIEPVTFDRWTGFSALADEKSFALAMPGAVGDIWNDGRFPGMASDDPDDVGYLGALIDHACGRLPIDRRRVYLVGMSNGATMAGRLACEHPGWIAALAQVAGTVAADIPAGPRPAIPVPILQIHGTRDRFAPYRGGRASGLGARLILRRSADPSLGVDDWAGLRVATNRAVEGPLLTTLPPDTTVRRWRGPSRVSDVTFYRIEGGGHTWPGNRRWTPPFLGRTSGAFDATRAIWDFFEAQARET